MTTSTLRFIAVYLGGYVIAVVTASTIAISAIILRELVSTLAGQSSFAQLAFQVFQLIVFGSCFTAVFALPGYLFTNISAWAFRLHNAGFYLAGGMLTAYLAHLLANWGVNAKMMGTSDHVFPLSLVGGAIGGLVFFQWRKKVFGTSEMVAEGTQP